MKKKIRILLTGDDGYDSPGTRILARVLRDNYDCTIVGTVDQQSGVGGHLSIKSGGKYGETTVEGIPAIWVDGYPCDGIEFIVGRFEKPFDLVVSGINWGMNIGGAILSSGTYVAANRVLNLKLARRAIAMSWHVPPIYWTDRHDGRHRIDRYLLYPGVQAKKLVDLALANDNWQADLLNINFPAQKTNTVLFTKHLGDLRQFFNYPIEKNQQRKTFRYPRKELQNITKNDLNLDTGAMLAGYISVTPHKAHMLDEKSYRILKGKKLILEK